MGKGPDERASGGGRPSRVVVLIDASPDALSALEAAAELARRHDVPLLAVSVEEPDRSRSSGYSFAREVGAVSGSIRSLGPSPASRRGERGPSSIRRAVERASRAADVAWELIVLRGRLVDEVLALSRPDDHIVLGRVGWSARLGRRMGRSPLVLARRAVGTVHICSAAPVRERGRVAVLIEDIDSAGGVLDVAAARARAAGLGLLILLAPTMRDAGDIDQWLGTLETPAWRWRWRKLPALSTGEMLRALAEDGAVELVAARNGSWLGSSAAERLLAHWRMPVLVAPARSRSEAPW